MEWKCSSNLVDYADAVSFMEGRVADIRAGRAKAEDERSEGNPGEECVWLVEHPSLYTAGTSAKSEDLIDNAQNFPVYETGRGGQYTYHGPGQRVGYVMMDLKTRQKEPDLKKYIWQLEQWIIQSLRHFDIQGERRDGRVGIWVVNPITKRENKIAAIGVRVRHWVTYHGIAINICPDLSHFDGIIPCGIKEFGVTSIINEIAQLNSVNKTPETIMPAQKASLFAQIDTHLRNEFDVIFD